MRIAIIGSNGLVGSAVYSYFTELYNTIGITRENYDEYCGEFFDVVINANGNSKRYWAAQNILEDFRDSTFSVYKSLFDFDCGLYVYISSADVYGYLNDGCVKEQTAIDLSKQAVYGFHKYISEKIVQRYKDKFLILRCSVILGNKLKKGVVYDIMNYTPLFVTKDSKLQFITTDAVSDIIATLINDNVINKIINVGGVGNTSTGFIEKLLSVKANVSEDAETQICNMDVSVLNKLYCLESSDDYVKKFIRETR